MSFEFSASRTPMAVGEPLKEPPDKGPGKTKEMPNAEVGGSSVTGGVSFRDKVLGLQNVPQRERVDMVEKKNW